MIHSAQVNNIIQMLKEIDVDGETMQYIIEQAGMEEQMLRQLVMCSDSEHLRNLIEEKVELIRNTK